MLLADIWGMNDLKHADEGPIQVAVLLLFMQGALAVTLAVEAVGSAIIFGGASAISALLSIAGAVVTLMLVSKLRRRRRSARRWVMSLQIGWVVFALVDLGLALALAGRGLTPVGFLVRIVLPVSIFWLLRRPAVRTAFSKKAPVAESHEEDWELEEVWA
ncbi:MAG: hypothetical protein BMS9Abin17_0556 [Acidimicrobiia bacterium]|nr:MAG: hypothetical protein BMS9Abin17_0556 [Acidimicrobiia bacterium]